MDMKICCLLTIMLYCLDDVNASPVKKSSKFQKIYTITNSQVFMND